MRSASVAIIGAGPVGLSAAILCGRFGLEAVVIEKHPSTSIHPKARGVTIRTMELFRQWGIETEVRDSGVPAETRSGVTFTSTLAAPNFTYIRVEDERGTKRFSPTAGAGCPQDHLERVLASKAASFETNQLRFGEALLSLRPDGDAVDVETADATTGERRHLRARWIIGADGARSSVRDLIGSRLEGPADLSHNMNILFEADLRSLLEDHPSRLYWIADAPRVTGVLAPVRGYERWLLNVVFDPAQLSANDFDVDHCRNLVHRAIGDDSVAVNIINAAPWTAAAQSATSWRSGGAFLAGDAAHLMPPYGGFGMNTGVQDVHNLVWKLAALEAGWGGEQLLDSYEAERRPVTEWTIDQAMRRMSTLGSSQPNVGHRILSGKVDERVDGIVFGYTYDGSPVVDPDGSCPPTVDDEAADYVPSGRPGARAPHVPIVHSTRQAVTSTIDLFDLDFTLLVGAHGGPLAKCFVEVAGDIGVPISIERPGEDFEPQGSLRDTYGLDVDAAVLVRPDGYIAARLPASAGRGDVRAAVLKSVGRLR